jgi:hypothetical protein
VAPLALLPPEAALSPLEERLRRLEDALAQLQDGKGLETRVAERVAVRLGREAPAAVPVAPPVAASTAGMLLGAGKRLLGAAATAVRQVPGDVKLVIVASGWWVPGGGVPVFGTYFHPLLVKGIDLLLAFVLFKVLGYEARRYRETAPDLPPTLRL